jgi:D-aminopeptidase
MLDSAGHDSEAAQSSSQTHGSMDKGIFRYMSSRTIAAVFVAFTVSASLISAQAIGRTPVGARALGVPFDGSPGPLDAITDVKGIEVGSTTLISGNGALRVGEAPVRTGVTAIFPRGKHDGDPVYAGWFSLNGNGEMTGTTWVEESGFLEGPIALTNTHSVGVVRDSIIAWSLKHNRLQQPWSLPVVAETGTAG